MEVENSETYNFLNMTLHMHLGLAPLIYMNEWFVGLSYSNKVASTRSSKTTVVRAKVAHAAIVVSDAIFEAKTACTGNARTSSKE